MYRFVLLFCLLLSTGCGSSYNTWEGSLDAQFAFRESEGIVFVHDVKPDTFAHDAGLKPGDLLVAIDQKKLKGVTLPEFLDSLRGPVGTSVILTVERAGKTLDISIERRPITKSPFKK